MSAVVHLRLLFLHGAAEQRANPVLRGRPVLVFEGGRVRGLSREAAGRGVKTGARLSHARHACPDAAFLPYDPERYRRFATAAWDACASVSPRVEPLAEDEIFLDLPGPPPREQVLVAGLCREVESLLGTPVAAGCASCRLVARVASTLAAEAPGGRGGVMSVDEGREAPFLAPLPVERLWPLDAATLERLRRLGLPTLGTVARMPRHELCRQFGLLGGKISDLSRGLDPSPVLALYPPARLAFEMSLDGEVADGERLDRALNLLAARLASGLERRQQACRHLILRVQPDAGEVWEGSRRFLRPRREAPALAAALRVLLYHALAGLITISSAGDLVPAGLGKAGSGPVPAVPGAEAGPGPAVEAQSGPAVTALEAEAGDLVPASWGQAALWPSGGGEAPLWASGGATAPAAADPDRCDRLSDLMEALEKRYCSRVLTLGWRDRDGCAGDGGRRELLLGLVDPFRGAGSGAGAGPGAEAAGGEVR